MSGKSSQRIPHDQRDWRFMFTGMLLVTVPAAVAYHLTQNLEALSAVVGLLSVVAVFGHMMTTFRGGVCDC